MRVVLDMDLSTMIKESTTLAQLLELEKKFSFNEHEKTLIFEQRISILGRLMQWGVENEGISDSFNKEGNKKVARFTDFYSQGTRGRCLPYDAIRICLAAF